MTETIDKKVFDTIVDRLRGLNESIGLFTSTGYSFEEWVSWEAFVACKGKWTGVHPKPAYADILRDSRSLGDLKVVVNANSLWLEIALVHDKTGDKWIEKINSDTKKLRNLPYDTVRLQMLVVVSSELFSKYDDSWERWLNRTNIYQTKATHDSGELPLKPKGEMRIIGWIL